jgi:hypothetical protein
MEHHGEVYRERKGWGFDPWARKALSFSFLSSLVDVAVVWLRKDYTNLFAVNS